MSTWTGTIYSSGTITASGNSGWISLIDLILPGQSLAIKRAYLAMVPSGLATDETLDLDLNIAWDDDGNGDVKVHDWTQVTATNVTERLILPGGDSAAILVVAVDLVPALIPPYWKFSHTLGGTTKSMAYSVYGTLEF